MLPEHFVPATGITADLVIHRVPVEVPRVHVESLWRHQQEQRSEHAWLRLALFTAARRAFAGGRF